MDRPTLDELQARLVGVEREAARVADEAPRDRPSGSAGLPSGVPDPVACRRWVMRRAAVLRNCFPEVSFDVLHGDDALSAHLTGDTAGMVQLGGGFLERVWGDRRGQGPDAIVERLSSDSAAALEQAYARSVRNPRSGRTGVLIKTPVASAPQDVLLSLSVENLIAEGGHVPQAGFAPPSDPAATFRGIVDHEIGHAVRTARLSSQGGREETDGEQHASECYADAFSVLIGWRDHGDDRRAESLAMLRAADMISGGDGAYWTVPALRAAWARARELSGAGRLAGMGMHELAREAGTVVARSALDMESQAELRADLDLLRSGAPATGRCPASRVLCEAVSTFARLRCRHATRLSSTLPPIQPRELAGVAEGTARCLLLGRAHAGMSLAARTLQEMGAAGASARDGQVSQQAALLLKGASRVIDAEARGRRHGILTGAADGLPVLSRRFQGAAIAYVRQAEQLRTPLAGAPPPRRVDVATVFARALAQSEPARTRDPVIAGVMRQLAAGQAGLEALTRAQRPVERRSRSTARAPVAGD